MADEIINLTKSDLQAASAKARTIQREKELLKEEESIDEQLDEDLKLEEILDEEIIKDEEIIEQDPESEIASDMFETQNKLHAIKRKIQEEEKNREEIKKKLTE